VAESLTKVFDEEPKYLRAFEAIAEPERSITFRVPWEDDNHQIQINRGFRFQFNSAIGPYKGGCRFHPTVTASVLKFLGFEQIFKNSLTTLPMGGGKGGSDFDPKGKSDDEVRRFCVSFMTELSKHIGPDTDVPAGDIGVGGREIGFMNGAYKRIMNQQSCVLTGKDKKWGGSLIRPEATGYGCVYFAKCLMDSHGKDFKEKIALVSGSGNVSTYCIEKLLDLGAKPITMSDSAGSILVKGGITREILAEAMHLKNVKRGRISEMQREGIKYFPGKSVWELGADVIGKADLAFPCATQNEIRGEKVVSDLKKMGVFTVSEGANMPSDAEACAAYVKNGIILCPGKAANAGGVAVSGLEMSQNSMRLNWTREEVDKKLNDIMTGIYIAASSAGARYGKGKDDLVTGANVAGFLKVADSMFELGMIN